MKVSRETASRQTASTEAERLAEQHARNIYRRQRWANKYQALTGVRPAAGLQQAAQ